MARFEVVRNGGGLGRQRLVHGLICTGLLGWGAVCAGNAWAADMDSRCDFRASLPGAPATAQTVVQIVLSPRMPYALHEWRRMAASAQAAGFEVSTWRDPRVPKAEWLAAVDIAELPELRTAPILPLELAKACGVLNHAPATVLARCSHGHPWPILGVMPDAAWLQLLDARRIDLEQAPCP